MCWSDCCGLGVIEHRHNMAARQERVATWIQLKRSTIQIKFRAIYLIPKI